MKTLVVKTVAGVEMEITGNVTQKKVDGELVYYVNNMSVPSSIVVKIK